MDGSGTEKVLAVCCNIVQCYFLSFFFNLMPEIFKMYCFPLFSFVREI